MIKGKDFEVSKDVYERAKERYFKCNPDGVNKNAYSMLEEDREELFSISILYGYGLYDCKVREENGKYICSYSTGNTCD